MDSAPETPDTQKFNPEVIAQKKKAGARWAVLTAYDYPGARLLEEAGVDWLLVGDSLGMVVLGHPDTTWVTLADMEHHTRAVARGVRHTPVVADLPYQTYQTPDQAVASAKRLIEAGAHAVKLEGGREMLPQVNALRGASIPVMGHLGMLPQSIREEGAYRVKGKTEADTNRLLEDARALEEAGVFAFVLELVQPDAAAQITRAVRIPTIGIGSGSGCDGQVLVTHDLVGAFPWFTPKFAVPRASIGEATRNAARAFVGEVKGVS
jgi:3-methyl-2-oxobutanoate hydroxymethyltransferase